MSLQEKFEALPIGSNLVVQRNVVIGWCNASRTVRDFVRIVCNAGFAVPLVRRTEDKKNFDLIVQRVK